MTDLTLPTRSGWRDVLRSRLRKASAKGTHGLDPTGRVLAAIVAKAARVAVIDSAGIAEHAGLTRAQVAQAVRDLAADGARDPGSSPDSIRIVSPALLSALSLPEPLPMRWRDDEPPHHELTQVDLAAAFSGKPLPDDH